MADLVKIIEILDALVGFDTTSERSNLPLIEFAEDRLRKSDCKFERIPDAEGRKTSLWATFGPEDRSGYILSGHSDTVPAPEWTPSASPFSLYKAGDRLYGRGTTDMKGFLAVILAHSDAFTRAPLRVPIHLAISYDEEIGCVGVRPMLDRLAGRYPKPLGCFVGEPTKMGVVIGHKAKRAFRTQITGSAGHSSCSPRFVNAIEWAARLIDFIRSQADNVRERGRRDPHYDVSHMTILTTMIVGGSSVNTVPDTCSFTWEVRSIDAEECDDLVDRVFAFAGSELEPRMRESATASSIRIEETVAYPGLNTAPHHDLVQLALTLSESKRYSKVAFGTEAGLFETMTGVPSVVLGPGSIAQAHTTDEYIEISQLRACSQFVENLTAFCSE